MTVSAGERPTPPHILQTGTFTTRRNVIPIPTIRSLTAPHWQLHDLVKTTAYCPGSVFYINNQVLREVDIAVSGKITRALPSWEFVPRSIAILDDLVMAGSEQGWIQAQSLNKSKGEAMANMKSQLSKEINNSICLYVALDGTRRALIGNNDRSVKIWNVDQWKSDGIITLPVPINHCSVSPDKTSMVCVGDSSEIFLFDISTSGYFHHKATFTGSDDYSFSTAFSPTSSVFAVASQDGVISIWDRRFAREATPINITGKLATLKTSRPGSLNGASRCIAFSEGPIDLMMFTEQKEYVHLVDARTFEKRQILKLGEMEDSSREPDIGGACFSPDGKSVVVANERTLYQWEIDKRGRKLFPSVEMY